MAIKFTKVCGADRPRTKLDFGRIAKKVTKIHHPGCCGYMIAGGSLCSVRSALLRSYRDYMRSCRLWSFGPFVL